MFEVCAPPGSKRITLFSDEIVITRVRRDGCEYQRWYELDKPGKRLFWVSRALNTLLQDGCDGFSVGPVALTGLFDKKERK